MQKEDDREPGKRRRPYPRRALRRYLAAHLIGLVPTVIVLALLQRVLGLSTAICLLALLAWILKDALLFPLVWRSYDHDDEEASWSLKNVRATVVSALSPRGQVKVQGVLWQARLENEKETLPLGAGATVVGREGLTLTVRPLPQPTDEGGGISPIPS